MIIKGTQTTHNVEIDVSNAEIVDGFLSLIKKLLPKELEYHDLSIENDELYIWVETGGHNRDWTAEKVNELYPTVKITKKDLTIAKFYKEVEKYKTLIDESSRTKK